MTDLIAKHKDAYQSDIENLNLITEHPKFKVGQKITFNAGYNNNIRYLSEITGFDAGGGIYVIWDCFWSPIHDEERRNIKLF